jgi:nicotinate-nucleotide adenylyltransferase
MRIALFGGTFNPIHQGHLLMAEAAREHFKLDRVVFIPTGEPPHKDRPHTSAAQRLAMVRLALRGNPAFSVSDWEVRQKGVVYTYQTLAHFRKRWSRYSLFFLLGTDSLKRISSWQQGAALLRQYPFLAVERPEVPWVSLPKSLRLRAHRVRSGPVPFASHQIRRRVRLHQSIRFQVPQAVERYIRRHGLYRKPE